MVSLRSKSTTPAVGKKLVNMMWSLASWQSVLLELAAAGLCPNTKIDSMSTLAFNPNGFSCEIDVAVLRTVAARRLALSSTILVYIASFWWGIKVKS